MNSVTQKGFGLAGIIVVAAVVAAFAGGWYINHRVGFLSRAPEQKRVRKKQNYVLTAKLMLAVPDRIANLRSVRP